jgi:hypothetical protein
MFKSATLFCALAIISLPAFSTPRTAIDTCEEFGRIVEDMTPLIFQADRNTILKKMSAKYPESVKYLPTLLAMVLDPPIMDGAALRKSITEKCIANNTESL